MLEFEITRDDLVAYNVYAGTTTPTAKKLSAGYRVWASLAVAVVLAVVAAVEGHWVEGLVLGVVGGAALWFLWPQLWLAAVKRNVLRLAKVGGLGTPGPCRVWFDEDGIHDATPSGTSSATWRGVDRIEETASHVFVFIGPIQAYIIPKRVGDSAVRDFVSAVSAGASRAATSD